MKERDRFYQNHYGIDFEKNLFGFFKYIYIHIKIHNFYRYIYIFVYDKSMSITFFEISGPYKSESRIGQFSFSHFSLNKL